MTRLAVAVIGAGSFGRHHVRHLSGHPLVASLTVVDRDGARAAELAAAHDAASAATADGLALDAAVVAVPTEMHREVAAPLLARGVATLVEKPIAGSVSDARALIAAAQDSGAVLQVGHIERYSAPFAALSAAAGTVRHIAARRHNAPRPAAPSADVVLDLMIHDIDLALSLAGAPVASVSAFAPDGTGQEAASALITFANGAVAELSASRLAPVVERTLTVHGTGGVFHADLVAGTLGRCVAGKVTNVALSLHDNLRVEIDAFLSAVRGDTAPPVTGVAGCAALEVAERVRGALCEPYKLSA